MLNVDEIAKLIVEKWELLAAIVTLAGASGIGGACYVGWQNRRKAQRLRHIPRGDFPFEVIEPGSSDLLKQIMGGDEQNPLADCNIPYQERRPELNVRQELEAAFTEKNWVLILGKSGLGKTREAAHLAEVLNQEGWTVLKLAEQPGEWLDVPKQFPSEISPDDKLLFFLDDLNRWMYAGNPHEMHPEAENHVESNLVRPLREPVQERLPRLLRYFEQQGKLGYVRVIATARDEREPDQPGDLSPWEKLQWEKYKAFWQQFRRYALVEPSEGAIVRLLTDCVAAAGLQGNPAEYGQMARRNDGTFRNITVNLTSAQSRGLAVNDREFSPRLDETWRRRYHKVVQRYPLAKHVYDAVELLQALNLWLTAPMLAAMTQRLLPGRGLRRWWQVWQLRSVLRYLVATEQILNPKDGQIEAKKTGAVEVGHYVPLIWQLMLQMAKRDPTYPVAIEYFNCGNALFVLNLYKEAISSHDKALAIQPGNYYSWLVRGFALFHVNRYEEAISSYDQVLEIQPVYRDAWYLRGNTLFHLTRYEEAISSYDKALEIQPDHDDAWYSRGITLSALNRYQEAISSYDKALEIQPDHDDAWYSRGIALSALNRYDAALLSYDKALEIQPDNYYVWYDRGNALSGLSRYEEAISSYDKAAVIKPDFHESWYSRGLVYGILNRYKEAVTSFDRAVAIKPDNHEVWDSRGLALSDLNCYEEAISSYDQAVLIKPDFHEAWYNRGNALDNLNRFEEAIASYDQAVAAKPDYYRAWDNRGDVLMNLERYQAAIASYDRAIAINPEYRFPWKSRATAFMKLGQFKAAHESFDQAILLNSEDAEAYYNNARCYALQGNVKLAIENLQRAIQLNPDHYRQLATTDLGFDSIRDNPRFQTLLNQT